MEPELIVAALNKQRFGSQQFTQASIKINARVRGIRGSEAEVILVVARLGFQETTIKLRQLRI
jgi:hypothetical protein